MSSLRVYVITSLWSLNADGRCSQKIRDCHTFLFCLAYIFSHTPDRNVSLFFCPTYHIRNPRVWERKKTKKVYRRLQAAALQGLVCSLWIENSLFWCQSGNRVYASVMLDYQTVYPRQQQDDGAPKSYLQTPTILQIIAHRVPPPLSTGLWNAFWACAVAFFCGISGGAHASTSIWLGIFSLGDKR